MNALIALVTAILPSIVKLVQELYAHQNPGEPPPTSAEVIAGLASACASSLAVDEEWLAAHPPESVP
jgi:hypothetical protein